MAKILVKLPDDLLALVDVIAKQDHQNRSEFVRASLLKACREAMHKQSKYKYPGTESAIPSKKDEEEESENYY